MKLIAVAFAAMCVAAAFASTGVPTVTVCSAPGAILSDLTYTITPHDVEPGSELKVVISGTLSQSITSATVALSVSFDNIPIITKNLNLCGKDVTCPVPAGPFTYTISHSIPNLPVSGNVDAKAVITAQNSLQVACVDVAVNI